MYDVFIMDMGGHDDNVRHLQQRFPHAQTVRYFDTHYSTIKRCATKARTPFIWVIASCCDYSEFDFNYRAPPWEAYQIHCWASGTQKFGDTFLIPVAEFKKQQHRELLEWYEHINYHDNGVPRLDWEVIKTKSGSIVEDIKEYKFITPYAWINQKQTVDAILWRERAFYSFNETGTHSLAPRDISGKISTQIYDYPHIIKQKTVKNTDKPLDIVYISNGEPNATCHYKKLLELTNHLPNTVRHVKNINCRAQAYYTAAQASVTPWFFIVPAKIEIDINFDWNFQPDCLQENKHYIFYCYNPVTELEYGHMAVVMCNKEVVLQTTQWGLDFTMSGKHTVVPIRSGIARFNTTPLTTWRTAFREVIKLQDSVTKHADVESKHRLKKWVSNANGDNAEWSLNGAKDAIDYYKLVNGDFDKLKLSFNWEWLNNYFESKYKN